MAHGSHEGGRAIGKYLTNDDLSRHCGTGERQKYDDLSRHSGTQEVKVNNDLKIKGKKLGQRS